MFRTELSIVPATRQLSRTARVLTMGSCFADSMGTRLASFKVDALVNPFGTVFQPLALGRLLRAAAGEDVDWQQHLVQARGRWQSYDLHGSIGADSPVELLQLIQGLVARTGEFLRSADAVCLTLGTAWAYRLRETGELVNNCHKQNADLFVRELLTPDDIINGLAETHAYLRRINPELRFILTVSPVRHLKDTLQLNAVSKSVLRLATHILSDLLPDVAYFPAYELLNDDLRDYRFYAADMLHPSEVAEDYIWEKFTRTYFDAEFGRFCKDWAAVRQSLGHRPLHAGAPEHRQFLEATREKLEQLGQHRVDVAAELEQVQAQLAALPVPMQPEPIAELEDDEERIDIGESESDKTVPATTPATAEASQVGNRPPRLSPEEFRAQRGTRPERGRRDGRGKGRGPQPSENEQFQTAALAAEDLQDLADSRAALPELAVVSTASLDDDLEPAEQVPGQKKKRRSRGGAKRTARKHALRLASETDENEEPITPSIANPEGILETFAAENALEVPATETEENQSRSNSRSQSGNRGRGGRRDDANRVPRIALFAAPEQIDQLPPQPVDDITEAMATPASTAGVQLATDVTDDERNPASGSSRNSRNRNKRKGGNATANEQEATALAADAPVAAVPAASIAQLSGLIESVAQNERRNEARNQQSLPVAALPVNAPVAAAVTAMAAPAATSASDAPAPAKQPSSRKRRAITGGRAEKPAIDTPVIPVPDANAVRNVVAAGRMTGSSASLVEPSAAPKKAVVKAAATVAKTPSAKAVVAPAKPVVAPLAAPAAAPAVKAPVAKPKAAATAKPAKTAPKAASPAPAEAAPMVIKKPTTAKPIAAIKAPKTAPKPAAVAATPAKAPAAAPAKAKDTTKPAPKAAAKPTAAKIVVAKAVVAKAPVAKATVAKPTAAKPAVAKAPTAPKAPATKAATAPKAATAVKATAKPSAEPKPTAKPKAPRKPAK